MPSPLTTAVQPLRLALAPGERRSLKSPAGPRTIVVTRGSGQLIAEDGRKDMLAEGDVSTLAPSGFVLANACPKREFHVIVFDSAAWSDH
ncbi:hypothetical protein FG93_01165 [Bosea sp. LC85]|uniref:hypothetical protein n=1 Tax=Bosea sp. LC85 TaxID=1502851 RepID=UPI0004E40865|nr:hypothetical protein [Bosea sp. LC85]KFC74579.1 hypothetical protein FG93_01165 [Bosea sp. LC85]